MEILEKRLELVVYWHDRLFLLLQNQVKTLQYFRVVLRNKHVHVRRVDILRGQFALDFLNFLNDFDVVGLVLGQKGHE